MRTIEKKDCKHPDTVGLLCGYNGCKKGECVVDNDAVEEAEIFGEQD